jgi:glycine C-acetyltransferase
MEMEPELRERLWQNIFYMRDNLNSRGFIIDTPHSALIPLPVGDSQTVLRMKAWLLEQGLYVTHLVPPLVEESDSRLRLSIKAHQTDEDLNRALDRLAEARERFDIAH